MTEPTPSGDGLLHQPRVMNEEGLASSAAHRRLLRSYNRIRDGAIGLVSPRVRTDSFKADGFEREHSRDHPGYHSNKLSREVYVPLEGPLTLEQQRAMCNVLHLAAFYRAVVAAKAAAVRRHLEFELCADEPHADMDDLEGLLEGADKFQVSTHSK